MQPPYTNQPPQGTYPPQPPGYQFAPPQGPYSPPPRKPKRWPWFLAIFVALMIGYAAGSTSHSSSTAATSQASVQTATDTPAPVKPTPVPKWRTVQTFSGNGTKKTAIFTVPDDWKINYTCQGFTDGSGVDGALTTTVYASDGTYLDGAINVTCKAGKTTKDSTEEHQGGQVYLDINATGDWTIQVQALT